MVYGRVTISRDHVLLNKCCLEVQPYLHKVQCDAMVNNGYTTCISKVLSFLLDCQLAQTMASSSLFLFTVLPQHLAKCLIPGAFNNMYLIQLGRRKATFWDHVFGAIIVELLKSIFQNGSLKVQVMYLSVSTTAGNRKPP